MVIMEVMLVTVNGVVVAFGRFSEVRVEKVSGLVLTHAPTTPFA